MDWMSESQDVTARGNPIAAALAVRCGHSQYGLENWKDVTRSDVEPPKNGLTIRGWK